jgi:polar amino acid transport system permease protein
MTDYHFNFSYIWKHFDRLIDGLLLSLQLALISILIGAVIGLILAIIYIDFGKKIKFCIGTYVELIRNSPLLLLIYLVFYGIPSIGGFEYSSTMSFIITLSIYASAYLIEVFRSGLSAIEQGLIDAAKAIGLNYIQRLIYVRIPTMFRIVLPAMSNTYISLFKDTSLASVIAVPELMYGAQWINFNTLSIIEVYAVIAPMYLGVGFIILMLLRMLEKKYKVNM